MWKKIRRVLMIVLAVVFVFCAGTVAVVQHQYNVSKRLYRDASNTFTEPATLSAQHTADPAQGQSSSKLNDGIFRLPEVAPIKVDFEALKEVNTDVDGWIYCPDTVIDYPVMHGLYNDTYLYHSYDKSPNMSGSIFVDERNQRNFQDPVSILYGHHMANGSMFATLEMWQLPSYREEHPVMWLLTPEQDYKVLLYSAYTTGAYSDTYEIPLAGYDPTAYLARAEEQSAWHMGYDLDPTAHYILLSTCAYVFEDARSVVHGKLVPVMSAGGVPMT